MELIRAIHQMIWGPWTLALFLGTGIWFTIRSKAFQIRGFSVWWRETAGSFLAEKEEKTGKITPFQSACTALAATIGTGNIVGVATALSAGGPGALFWMWISALIGMITAYAETSLGQKYRYRKKDGHWMCGPMVYMERGLGCRAMGLLYAVFAVLCSLGMGSMVQSNSMSGTLSYSAGIPGWLSGVLITALVGAVILGGVGRIARVSERLMPVSAGIYMLFSTVVILSCSDELPAVFGSIFHEAFKLRAAAGGTAGFVLSQSIRYGLSRGVFSNEAGLGSLAVLHGAAEDTTPEKQGMWAVFEVFFDTIVVCTMTALVILCICQTQGGGLPAGYDGAALTSYCFARRLGRMGEILVSGAMVIFAFATIIAWYYLGRQTAAYLLGSLSSNERIRRGGERIYLMLYLLAVYIGCVGRLEVVWLISDIWNGLMAYPNILALLLLSGEVRYPEREISS